MFGNCATGKLSTVSAPTSTMTMEITMATMGRLMKNFDMGYLSLSIRWCLVFRHERFRVHVRACAHSLNPFHYDPVPRIESAGDNPSVIDAISHSDGSNVDFIAGVDDGDLISALQLRYRALRNQQRPGLGSNYGTDFGVTARSQNIVRIRKEPCDSYRTGALVDLPVGKINFDRVDGRDRCNDAATRRHQRADLQLRLASNTVNGRDESSEIEIDLCRFYRGFVGFDLCLGSFYGCDGGEIVLNRIIEVLLAGGLLFRQWLVALDIKLGAALYCLRVGQSGLCLGKLAIRLIERCLKRPRVDLEKKLPGFDKRAFLIALLEQVACNLGADVGIHQPIKSANPFRINWNIFFRNLHHFNVSCVLLSSLG